MDNIGVNYRPIKSFEELFNLLKSAEWDSNTYYFELRHLNPSFSTIDVSWNAFIKYINSLKDSENHEVRSCLKKVPEFNFHKPSIEYQRNFERNNATAVLNFLIEKGGVFVMLPPQKLVKEVPNE